eukprot:IDg979t1
MGTAVLALSRLSSVLKRIAFHLSIKKGSTIVGAIKRGGSAEPFSMPARKAWMMHSAEAEHILHPQWLVGGRDLKCKLYWMRNGCSVLLLKISTTTDVSTRECASLSTSGATEVATSTRSTEIRTHILVRTSVQQAS